MAALEKYFFFVRTLSSCHGAKEVYPGHTHEVALVKQMCCEDFVSGAAGLNGMCHVVYNVLARVAQRFLQCSIKIKFFICQDYQSRLLFAMTKGNRVSSTVNKRNILMSQTDFSTCTHPLRKLILNHSEKNSMSLHWMLVSLEKQQWDNFSLAHLLNLAKHTMLNCFSFLSSL